MNRFLDALAVRPLVCDGAMGTQLMARGMRSGECGMLWNTGRADDVLSVHRAYAGAGCEILTTNSFGGTSFVLGRHGQADKVGELNRAAASRAREVAGSGGFVFGDVGPFGDFLEPYGDTTADELQAAFEEQMRALVEGGVDAILIETMVDPGEVEVAIAAARNACSGLPLVTTYAFQKDASGGFRTLMGKSAAEVVRSSIGAGADVVGANCGTDLGLDDYLALARELVAAAGPVPVILQPNAGAPKTRGEETVYDATPGEMAALARRLLDAGVRVVGGCCGTSPAHLAAMAAVIRG